MAFYVMKYEGQTGLGGGAIYIGKGILVGADLAGGKYEGKYTEVGGRLKGAVKITAPPAGTTLVTGQQISGGSVFELNFDFSADFANGKPQNMVGFGGKPVTVTFDKISDLPE